MFKAITTVVGTAVGSLLIEKAITTSFNWLGRIDWKAIRMAVGAAPKARR
jgi:hypothetical protein